MSKRYKVLILSGGGVFGLIPSHFMSLVPYEELEKIDFIAGTSVGGILALCYASGKTPRDTKELFKEAVPQIFKKNWIRQIMPFHSLYSSKGIEHFLQDALRGTVRNCRKKFIVPCMDFRKKVPLVFHNLDNSFDHYELWKIGRSTSAAPIYFEPFSENVLIDGGIIENVPVGITFTALQSYLNIPKEQIDVFVIGTGTNYPDDDFTLQKAKRYSCLKWALELLPVLATEANEMLSINIGENLGFGSFHYYNPVTTTGQLDDATQVSSGKLEESCEIYNSLFRKSWKKFLNR